MARERYRTVENTKNAMGDYEMINNPNRSVILRKFDEMNKACQEFQPKNADTKNDALLWIITHAVPKGLSESTPYALPVQALQEAGLLSEHYLARGGNFESKFNQNGVRPAGVT